MTTLVTRGGEYKSIDAKFPFPTSTPQTTTQGLGSVRLISGRAATYEAMVRAQPWVFAAVQKLVYAEMRVSLKVYDGEDTNERKRLRDHELAQLINKPHRYWRRHHLQMWKAFDKYVHGNALLLKSRSNNLETPDGLYVIPWPFVQVIRDESGIIGYKVRIGGTEATLHPDDVIHHELMGGIAPMESLARTLALEDASLDWQLESFNNGVTPRGAFVLPKDWQPSKGPNGEDDLKKLRAELENTYVGAGSGGRFGLLWGGMKWEAMGQSAVDAEVIKQRQLSREEVSGAFDVPPPFLGILDKTSYNNIVELRRSFYVDSLGPRLELDAATWQAQLIDIEPSWDGVFVEYDLGSLLKPDNAAMADQAMKEMQSGTTTANERRAWRNLPPIGDPDDENNPANQLFFPVNMASSEQITAGLVEPVDDPSADGDPQSTDPVEDGTDPTGDDELDEETEA